MQYSEEQNAVINSNESDIIIRAFAGCGKSTTLFGYSMARSNKRILNTCFNKSVQLAADKRFPANVTNRTSHSLAYAKFGAQYGKASLLVSGLRPNDLKNIIPSGMSPTAGYVFASNLISVITNYISSADEDIGPNHLAGIPQSKYYDLGTLLPYATTLWQKMVSLQDPIGMVHDGYLKLWQLSRPNLSNYDIILLDEAQDTNPCLMDVIELQNTSKVLVGDEHQSIYGFRGSKDAMNTFSAQKDYALTATYRFGPNIALLANMLIHSFKNEKNFIRGMKPEDKVGGVDKTKQYAVIAKTNIGLFDQAVDAVNRDLKIHYVGGINGYGLDVIMDAYNLKRGETFSIRDGFIRTFPTYDLFTQYAQESEDIQCLNLIKINDSYGKTIPLLINKIKSSNIDVQSSNPASHNIEDLYPAQVFLTTAHKSKGLEFNQVILADDFKDLVVEGKYATENDLPLQDLNLHYVALTRARQTLQMNLQLKEFVQHYKQLKAARKLNQQHS